MMPNMNPKAMKDMMARMGIKTDEIDALRVVIECNDANIIIENPQVTKISAQGNVSFQVAGDVKEEAKDVSAEITADDVKMVMDKTGKGEDEARKALEESNGDIAEAILKLS